MILVVLFADSLHAVLPRFSVETYKLIGLLVIIPSSFLPLRVLSFASILGVMSTFTLIVVLLGDGVGKRSTPGSLWESADTNLLPASPLLTVPISFGLFMAGVRFMSLPYGREFLIADGRSYSSRDTLWCHLL